jgi:hypothetical protein
MYQCTHMVYVYLYLDVSVCMWMYMCVCVCVWVCMCMIISQCMYMYVHLDVYVYIIHLIMNYMCTWMYLYICVCAYVLIFGHIRISCICVCLPPGAFFQLNHAVEHMYDDISKQVHEGRCQTHGMWHRPFIFPLASCRDHGRETILNISYVLDVLLTSRGVGGWGNGGWGIRIIS